uniref:Xylanase inhibitor N-terminal domain-containing protein n=1 Tax=Solanum lycopersicum TaxID=4081 RepID=K4ATW8_SOLLC
MTDGAVDGILGFSQQRLSIISQLSSHGISPKSFSHCLKGEGSGGGILVLGEILHPSMVYTPLVPSIGFYKLGDRGTIVDFDTSLVYLVAEPYESIVNVVSILLTNRSQPQIYFLNVSS